MFKNNPKPIIFFDFDGVIADTFDIAYNIMRQRFPSVSRIAYRRGFEININDAIKLWSKKAMAKIEMPAGDFFKKYTPRLLRVSPTPNVPEAIQTLSQNFSLLIISSTISPAIRLFLKKYRLAGYFREIYGNEIQKSKIKKFHLALREFKVHPRDCVFITDTLGDIREAKKVNIKSLAVTWGYHSRKTLEKGSPWKLINKPSRLVKTVEKFFELNA